MNFKDCKGQMNGNYIHAFLLQVQMVQNFNEISQGENNNRVNKNLQLTFNCCINSTSRDIISSLPPYIYLTYGFWENFYKFLIQFVTVFVCQI